MCIAYKLNGKQYDYLPAGAEDQLKVKPCTKLFLDGKKVYKRCKKFENLPEKAKKYIKALEKFYRNKNIKYFPTSPERKDTNLIENPFA